VDMTADDVEDLYRILAIAKYDERYVVPRVHAEDTGRLQAQHCAVGHLDSTAGNAGHPQYDLVGAIAQPPAAGGGSQFRDNDGRTRFNLLGWNGSSPAPNLFGEGKRR
jgi:nitrate reductase / nitrite oxidoreductase, beta subunit